MKTHISTLLLLVFWQLSLAQSPTNLRQALDQLHQQCEDSLKIQITHTEDEKIRELFYPHQGDNKTVFDWFGSKPDSPIQQYYQQLGIAYRLTVENIILIAFKRELLQQDIRHEVLIAHYQKWEEKYIAEDKVRLITDTLRGTYIPSDVNDCIRQIDVLLSDSAKKEGQKWSENEFLGKTHLSLGMWLRNHWFLWAGSRLSKYFNDLGIYHPDDMSMIILTSYYRNKHGKEIKLQDQFNYYKDDGKKNKK